METGAPASQASLSGAPDHDCGDDREKRLRARDVLATVHAAVQGYRGGLWARLARARWQLLRTTTFAGLGAFLVLALALISNVSGPHLISGWAYFVTGAVAGLFLRLRNASSESHVTDDYGLEIARLYQTPLLSGIAAVIGVVIMASVAGSVLSDILNPTPNPPAVVASPAPSSAASIGPSISPLPSPSSTPSLAPSPSPTPLPTPSSTGDSSEPLDGPGVASASMAPPEAFETPRPSPSPSVSPSAVPTAPPSPGATPPTESGGQSTTARDLDQAFSLNEYSVGIIVALIFGLTPGLVLDRLNASLNRTKSALVSSQSTTSSRD
jgi:hypothetical protein